MKARIILTGATLILGMSANAQISVGKIKAKATEVKSTTKEVKTGAEEAKIDRSPAAESIRKLRFVNSSFKDVVERRDYTMKDKMKEMDQLIAKIRQDDPKWSELAEDEAAYNASKKLYDDAVMIDGLENELRSFADNSKWINDKYKYAEIAPRLERKKYDDLKSRYAASGLKSENSEKHIATADAFYANKGNNVSSLLQADADKAMERARYHNAEGRKNPKYIENFYKDGAPGALGELKTALGKANALLLVLPGDADITAAKNMLEAEIKDIDTYITSPQYASDIEAKKQYGLDQILLDPAGRKDPQMDAIVKRDMEKENGQIVRINLVSRDYYVYKTKAGMPLSKLLDVQTVTKGADGKCYRNSGYLKCQYEGGGIYGKPTYYTESSTEMNCANANK